MVSHGNQSRMEESVDWEDRLPWTRVVRVVRRKRSNRFGITIE